MLIASLLVVSMFVHGYSSIEAPSVVTKSGKIVGHYLTSFKGRKYEAYQGIPFALPPVGERRFKPPEPIDSWSGELLANRLRDNCAQNRRTIKNSEDCLYLNVFVPSTESNVTLPTIVWIHGGGFRVGGNVYEEEHYLMDYDVVFVTIQYRLGVLGFLSTEDVVVPGNMGLKDQSLALKWIHENIAYFKGDPQKIMLLGLSAGAASVHYHYLSPMSAGLFQSGISFSGTALNVWAVTKKSREKALRLGGIMNCSTIDTEKMVQCLRTRSVRDIIQASKKFSSWRSIPDVYFGPVVEQSHPDSFIDESPMTLINKGKVHDVPWITGVVSEEGLLVVAGFTDDASLEEIDGNWKDIAPLLLKYNDTVPKEKHANLSKIIREHYFADKSIDKQTYATLVHLAGDRWFIADAEKAARAQAKANENPVWFYYYSYRATNSYSEKLTHKTDNFGVCHGDDVYLVIKDDQIDPTKSPNDMLMHRDLIELLTSFAYNRVPNLKVEWPRVNSNDGDFRYLHISGPGKAGKKLISGDLGEKKFWDQLE